LTEDSAAFAALRSLKKEIEAWSQPHLDALDPFRIDTSVPLRKVAAQGGTVFGFNSYYGDDKKLSSLSSTATCIRSLFRWPRLKIDGLNWDALKTELVERHAGENLKTQGLENLNAYTVGQLLPMLKSVGFEAKDQIVIDSIAAATEAISDGGASLQEYPANGYLTYWILGGLDEWKLDVPKVAAKALEWSAAELYRQISFFSGHDDENSDAFQLGYNLLIQYRFARPGLREPVIEAALRTMFDAQLSRGAWEKKDPLFRYGEFGDAYPFSFELLNSVLTEFRLEYERLRPYELQLRQAFGWLRRNATQLLTTSGVRVWRSGHRTEKGKTAQVESWATAEAYSFLRLYRNYLAHRVLDLVLATYRGQRPRPADPQALDGLDHLTLELDENPMSKKPDVTTARPLNELLHRRLVDSLAIRPGEYSLARHHDPKQCARSGILSGEPGTGKSSAVDALGSYLGWAVVVLDPGDFAREGLLMLSPTAATIFDQLLELEDTLIFLDEMEEFMKDRKGDKGSFEQRLLTTSILPKLQALWDKAQCVFIVATNHFKDMDPAAARAKRFDFRFEVLKAVASTGSVSSVAGGGGKGRRRARSKPASTPE